MKNPESKLQGLVYFGRPTNCMIKLSDSIILKKENKTQKSWSICNTHYCSQLANTKSEQAKI